MQTIVGFRRKDGRTFLLDELFLKYKDTLPTSTAWNVLLLDFQLPREHVCATNPTCFPNHFWCQNDHLPFNLFPAQKHFLQGLWAVSTCYELTFKKWGGTCKWRSVQQSSLGKESSDLFQLQLHSLGCHGTIMVLSKSGWIHMGHRQCWPLGLISGSEYEKDLLPSSGVASGLPHPTAFTSVPSPSCSSPGKSQAQEVPSISHHGNMGLPRAAAPFPPAVLLGLARKAMEGTGCPQKQCTLVLHSHSLHSQKWLSQLAALILQYKQHWQHWLRGQVTVKSLHPFLHLCQIQSLLLNMR